MGEGGPGPGERNAMRTGDRDYPMPAGGSHPYPAEAEYPPRRPYRIQSGYFPSHQLRPVPPSRPSPLDSGPMLLQGPPTGSSPMLRQTGPSPQFRQTGPSPQFRQTGPMPAQRRPPHRIRRRRTWPQMVGGILIVGACVASAAWYVPRVMANDRGVITGMVSSSGVVALNFAASGQIGKINVHLNQVVHKGQVLAFEYAPSADSIVAADKATIAAVQAKIAQLRAAAAMNPA